MSVVNKQQLAEELASELKISKTAAKNAVSGVLNLLCKHLKQGEQMTFVGFGAFKVEEVPERTQFNGLLNKEVTVPAHKKVKFKPCPGFLNF